VTDAPANSPGLPAWPGIDEEALAAACSVIARRFVIAKSKSVGILPVAGALNLGPLIVRLAAALARFGDGKVGVIPRWRSWSRASAMETGGAGGASELRLGAMGPQIVAIVPPAAGDAREAALGLQPALWQLPEGISRVLVDLTGYTKTGGWPGAGVLVDAIALAVPRKAARRDRLETLLGAIPAGKNLGSILIG
jgi:hypothetical protein